MLYFGGVTIACMGIVFKKGNNEQNEIETFNFKPSQP